MKEGTGRMPRAESLEISFRCMFFFLSLNTKKLPI